MKEIFTEDPSTFNIARFTILDDFVIEVIFKNGKVQVIDFKEIKYNRGIWNALQELSYFNQVKLDLNNLEWPNGEDFNPRHLYYWDEHFRKIYSE